MIKENRDQLLDLLNEFQFPNFDENPFIDKFPFQISPLEYIGLGKTEIEESEFQPDVLRFDNTPSTMILEPVRNLLTGKIESYRDFPLSTSSADDSSLNRPINSIDEYHKGISTGVAFTPGGIVNSKQFDFSKIPQFLLSLDIGTNLLSTPLSQDICENIDDILPSLPESSDFIPSKIPTSKQQVISNELKSYSVIDEWDINNFSKEIPNPSLTFPYQLDPFQLRAIHRLELGQTAFVSAPTSAGKTVIAQYAISLCRSHKMRTLYTSPIKALSNQKFRDLSKQFGDVGILTGDITLNREASCLIMTTEILRSMLYHGADILRDVECVIFDECHFISNDERGVVWEECIILLPYHINMVFLSATVPNAMEIADWIGRTKQKIVYVQIHNIRPIPLEHALYTGNSKIYTIVEPKKAIDQKLLNEAKETINSESEFINYSTEYWYNFIHIALEKNLTPMLIFSFSKRTCHDLADIISQLDLLNKKEKKHVVGFCNRSLLRLPKEDRDLPQIKNLFKLLENGIGIHHGGILPILKEIVEILLSDGYIKVLFCTSTFAMGINVPVRSCTFVSLDKFNGKEVTKLTPTEYVQMSGRAGRRGLDTVGTSIIMINGKVPPLDYLKSIFFGKVEALQSQFKLRFNMILNLLRVRDIKMVDLLRRSLSANLVQSMMPELLKKLNETEKELKNIPPIDCVLRDIEDMSCFGYNMIEFKQLNEWIIDQIDIPSLLKHLMKGRVVFIINEKPTLVMIQEVLNEEKIKGINSFGETIFFNCKQISCLFSKPSKSQERMSIEEIKKFLSNFSEKPLNWTKILSTNDFEFVQASNEILQIYDELIKSPCSKCSMLQTHLESYEKEQKLLEIKEEYKRQMHDESLAFKPLLDSHIDILISLNYITQENVLLLKGRVAIEINYVHELLGTEMLFSSIFDDLTPEECASLISCLCCEGIYINDNFELIPDGIEESFTLLKDLALQLEGTMLLFNIPSSETFSQKNVNCILAQVVYDWALGKPFKQIMTITDVPEGSVVRTINIVNESLKDFSNASKLIGCMSLSQKFDKAAEIIKRDIIFASSLYFD